VFFKKKFGIPFLIGIVLLSAFRYYVGSDFDDYINLFNNSALGRDVPVEFSYSFISTALNDMGFNFQALIVLYSFLTYIFVYMGLREISREREFYGVMILFFYLIIYFPSLSIIRQALASAIAFWGVYRFLFRGDYVKFLMVVLVSFFFHVSSIFYLLCIPFYIFKLKKVFYLFGVGLAAILGFTFFGSILEFFIDITGFGFKGYSFKSTPLPVPVFLINTAVLGLGFIYVLIRSNLSSEDYFLINVVFFILIIRLLALDFQSLNRVSAGFAIFIPFFIYRMIYIKLTNNSRNVFFIILLTLMILSDLFRASKDYSYYQYSINYCIYGSPCPISIIGDLPLDDLLIPEVNR
jgi:hypothetical protein